MIDLDEYFIFAENKITLKEASKDDSDISNIQHMTDCELEVINFDLVKRKYANSLKLSDEVAASVDALLQIGDHIVFVEFKNGKVKNHNIKDKARDSLLIFCDVVGKTISYMRKRVDLIVVYNLEKNPLPNQIKKGRFQESPSRIAIGNYFSEKAQKEYILFDLQRYERLYFREVHTYSKEEFREYLRLKGL